ncbi:sterol desaturase family protein [Actinoplanes oblitus]|uniref:Sterol desaturase family protein n=1 Tax=Actinoplanes oblitus TaxID=3040509 RepID=A0ABY8WSM6_9ACTN|nr:sterol desaturase family protein [Actinoplanes oblitus]WIN00826.1 sterol desaturase family protein [Actinoplanes oblitus]
MLEFLRTLHPGWCALLALVENTALVGLGALLGHGALRLPGARRLTPAPGPVSGQEYALVASTTLINTAITVAGWWLWRAGVIALRPGLGPGAIAELIVLVMVMDVLMYAGHATAHLRVLFPWVHRLHHVFADARPITLFALHPLEAIGFGAMWLVVLAVHPFTVAALTAYTVLNLVFGILGHLGVEPLPPRVRRNVIFRWVATPTMHVGHHAEPRYNLGFYTTVWDRVFRTLEPGYDTRRTATVPEPYRRPAAAVAPD